MAKRKTRISKLRVNEVSLVDRPANPAARVVLAKRDDADEVEKGMSCKQCGKKGDTRGGYCASCAGVSKAIEYNAALDMSIEEILMDGSLPLAKQAEMLNETVGQFRDSILALVKTESVDAPAPVNENQENNEMSEVTKADLEQITKGLSTEQAAAVEAAIAKAVGAVKSEQAQAIEKAQNDAKAARDEIAKRDRLSKAAVMVRDTAVSKDSIAKALEAIGDNTDVVALFDDVLAKYDAAMKAGRVLDELGSVEKGAPTGPMAELETLTSELMKADTKLTYAVAFAKAAEMKPELYEKSLTK